MHAKERQISKRETRETSSLTDLTWIPRESLHEPEVKRTAVLQRNCQATQLKTWRTALLLERFYEGSFSFTVWLEDGRQKTQKSRMFFTKSGYARFTTPGKTSTDLNCSSIEEEFKRSAAMDPRNGCPRTSHQSKGTTLRFDDWIISDRCMGGIRISFQSILTHCVATYRSHTDTLSQPASLLASWRLGSNFLRLCQNYIAFIGSIYKRTTMVFSKWCPRPVNNLEMKQLKSHVRHDDPEIMSISHIHVLLLLPDEFYCYTGVAVVVSSPGGFGDDGSCAPVIAPKVKSPEKTTRNSWRNYTWTRARRREATEVRAAVLQGFWQFPGAVTDCTFTWLVES